MKTETENAVTLALRLATEGKTPEQIALALYAKVLYRGLALRIGDVAWALCEGLCITQMQAEIILDDLFKYPDSEEYL